VNVTGWSDRGFFLLAVVLYGIATAYSIFVWRRGFRTASLIGYLLLVGAGLFHTTAMVKRGFSLERCPVNNLYEAMTFVMWTIVASYLAIGLWPRLRFLGAFVAPALFGMGVFALMPALDVHGPKPQFVNGLASLHASVILLAYGAFGLSSVAAAMFLQGAHDLKFRKSHAAHSMLPPIERLERVSTRLLTAGFILLTLGLAQAPFLMKQTYGHYFFGDGKVDPKILWSVLIWFLYGGLLLMRWRFSQRGPRFAWGNIGSFSFLLLTFWGVNLLSRIHNPP